MLPHNLAVSGSRLHGGIREGGEVLAAWVDLIVRVGLALAFLRGDLLGAMHGTGPAMMASGPFATAVNAFVASPVGHTVQTVCPVLLLLGLSSRFAAAALLIQTVLLRGPDPLAAPQPSWSALLGWLIVQGAGPVSFDALLGRGLDTSAIPGAATTAHVLNWITVHVEPLFRASLRLWIAGALIVPAGLMPERPGVSQAFAAWGPSGLAPAGSLQAITIPVLALFLGVGLATRGCALLLLIASLAQPSMAAADHLYWGALLGLIACHGPGRFALDHLVVEALHGVGHRHPTIDASLPHVVILGGGFGGVAAARGLRGAPCRITLVDRNNHHLFQPLLYQVATAGLPPTAIATPIRSLFRSQANLSVLLAEVEGISPQREVMLDRGCLAFDYLVVATGAGHGYFGRDDWAAVAPGLKRLEDATAIRGRLLLGFERAEASRDPAERARWLTFVIVGGGPTGVEMAGALAELARNGLADEFRAIDPATARIVLVQAADRLLPTFPASLSVDADAALRGLGIEILTGARVDEIDAEGVVIGGTRLEARTVLWAAGVTASPAAAWLGQPADRAGRIVVGPDLSVGRGNTVFAIGDTAASMAWAGQPVPGLAPAAKQAGAYVAKVIRARLSGRPTPPPFRYRHPGSIATIGRRAAVAEFGAIRLRGALAWWVWGTVHILFLAGGRNRAAVVLEWVWAYITWRRGGRLITHAMAPAVQDPSRARNAALRES